MRPSIYQLEDTVVEQAATIKAVTERAEAAEAMLKRLDGYIQSCPVCNYIVTPPDNHAHDCELKRLLEVK